MCNALLVVDDDAGGALMEAILLVALEANLEACMAGLDYSDEMETTARQHVGTPTEHRLSTHYNEDNPL